MKIGIDVDGVLARFDSSYAVLLKEASGIDFPVDDPNWPYEWYWERAAFDRAGLSKQEAKAIENTVWEHIKNPTNYFWAKLHPYPGVLSALQRIERHRRLGHEFYFITSRPGDYAKYHTELWFRWHGLENPTVMISYAKGDVARGLALDAFVEDKPENATEVWEARRDAVLGSSKLTSYLIDKSYNQECCYHAYERVKHINDVLDVYFPESKHMRDDSAVFGRSTQEAA